MNAKRCLIVVSGEPHGSVECCGDKSCVSAFSFIQAFGLLSRAHIEVGICTPKGVTPSFQCDTEEEERWIQDNQTLVSAPLSLQEVVGSEWDALCLPSSRGAIKDLSHSDKLGSLVVEFAVAKKAVCVIGWGVLGLRKAVAGVKWVYDGYNITGCSNMELARLPYFAKLNLLPEEVALELGGLFVSSQADAVFICVDRTLISAQNVASTTLACLNLIWLINDSG
jgi:hypothetical protein